MLLFILLLLILRITFKIDSTITFYFLFEVALIPIFLIVLGWGYQPERLSASVNLFLYTVFASLPLLMLIIIIRINFYLPSLSEIVKIYSPGETHYSATNVLIIILLGGFLVKYPLYSVHL
jgi:NADH-ubiquinone oxidoreductase chain 4